MVSHGHEWPTPTLFVQCQSALPFWDAAFHGQGHVCGQRSRLHLTLKFKGQGHGQGQTHWSHLRPGGQSICLLFVSWQSDHFWLRYSKLHIWPSNFKVKLMAKVKLDGHIWGLKFNPYFCFLFRVDPTIFGWDIANSIFDLENSRSWSQRPKSNQVIYRSGPTIMLGWLNYNRSLFQYRAL